MNDISVIYSHNDLSAPDQARGAGRCHTSPLVVASTPITFGLNPDEPLSNKLKQMMQQVLDVKVSSVEVQQQLAKLNKVMESTVPVEVADAKGDVVYVEESYVSDTELDRESSLPDYLYMESGDPRTLFIEEFSDDEEDDDMSWCSPSEGVAPLVCWDLDEDLDDGYVSHLDDDLIFG